MSEEEHIDIDEEFTEEYAGDEIKKLKDKLKECKKERQEFLEGWQRAKADFVNAKKENEAHKKEYIQYAEENLIQELFPVVDSFDMAFANKEAWEKVDKNWRVGVEYIHSQMMAIFESHGLKTVNPIGESFDPGAHNSVESVPAETEKQDHKIVEVMQQGYQLHDKIIRPAKVVVAIYQKDGETPDEN